MILDKNLMISESQALTATAYSENSVDLGAAGYDPAVGEPLALVINVEVDAKVSATNETYQFNVCESENANLSSETLLEGGAYDKAILKAGKTIVIPIPPGRITKRYIGLKSTLGGTDPTITISAHICPLQNAPIRKDYASGWSIS